MLNKCTSECVCACLLCDCSLEEGLHDDGCSGGHPDFDLLSINYDVPGMQHTSLEMLLALQ